MIDLTVPNSKKIEHIENNSIIITEEQKNYLKVLFPEVFTENKVDFDYFKILLGDLIDTRPDIYTFQWAGKQEAIRVSQTPSTATLKLDKNLSINCNQTKNIFIEGENLEVLKILYKSYFNKIKMIYIDPPYNIDGGFIYPDNFTDSLDFYLRYTGQKDEDGNLLVSKLEKSGRYHSSWLSMMYPRLLYARQLLSDDGVIFVSIDETEVYNLRRLMNLIFGEENFIAEYIWKSRSGKSGTIKNASFQHEYILCYAKPCLTRLKMIEKIKESGTYEDEQGKYSREQLRQWGQADKRENRKTMYYAIKGPNGNDVYPIKNDGTEGRWRCGIATANKLLQEGNLDFEFDGTRWQVYKKIRVGLITQSAYGTILEGIGTYTDGTNCLQELFGEKINNFSPKPPSLIKFLIELATWDNDEAIIMDFFAGSCTTAQAVLEINHEENVNKQFIMVQFPEPIDVEKYPDIAKKYPTMSSIGIARIHRYINKISSKKQSKLIYGDCEEDLGFKVFKLSESNFLQWEPPSTDTNIEDYIKQMELIDDRLKYSSKLKDIIYEVAIREGYSLIPNIKEVVSTNEFMVWNVEDEIKEQNFYISISKKLNFEILRSLKLSNDDLFICRNVALDDTIAANLALQCRFKVI